MKYLAMFLFLAVAVFAENTTQSDSASGAKPASAIKRTMPDLASQVPGPRAEDVKTMDGLLRAIYDVISGPVGDRDWNRFRSLFVPYVRFTQTGRNPDGSLLLNPMNEEEFILLAKDVFKQAAFYENAIVNQAQTYGNITQVFSSYESRRAPGGKPFERGINSIQMLNDGKRWWVLSILWDSERADNPLPAEFATAKK